jgi:hypothetical protein
MNTSDFWAMKHRMPFDSQTGAARRNHSLFEDVAQNSIETQALGLLSLSETCGGDSKHSSKLDSYLLGRTVTLILHEVLKQDSAFATSVFNSINYRYTK